MATKLPSTAITPRNFADLNSKDSIAQGNLITVTLKNPSAATSAENVRITLSHAKFVDGDATTKDVSIAAGTETQVTFVLDGTNNATITVANK